jgi:hypothetical protein
VLRAPSQPSPNRAHQLIANRRPPLPTVNISTSNASYDHGTQAVEKLISWAEVTMASLTPTTRVPRRSVSLPVPRRPSGPDPQIEVLYTLPSARIISFQTSSSRSRSSSSGDSPSLPWISQFERTIAVGMKFFLFLRCGHQDCWRASNNVMDLGSSISLGRPNSINAI